MFKYNLIDENFYNKNKVLLNSVIKIIWKDKESSEKAISAIWRSHASERDSFHYTIEKDNKIIWITWFYRLKNNKNLVWLNHHWILEEYRWKWLWKSTLNDLLHIIKKRHSLNIEWIIEIVPDKSTQIETIFKKMWFIKLSEEEVSYIETIDELLKEWFYKTAFIFKTKKESV